MALILGIDDAGRGPIIGPMILAGVLIDSDQEKILKEKGVADSKILIHNTRIKLEKEIKENSIDSHIVKSTPEEIDNSINSGINLNTLEAKHMAEIINKINETRKDKRIKVIVDCPSVNTSAWKKTLLHFVRHPQNLNVLCEHKADVNHTSVSAASILAKVERENEIFKLKKQYKIHGELGSGYPSDQITKEFLKTNGEALKDSGLFRKSWQTWKKSFPQLSEEVKKGQASLGDF